MDDNVEARAGTLVLPGEVVVAAVGPETKLKIGPGLRRDNARVVASKAGVLQFKRPSTVWVDSLQKRYVAVQDEFVVGVVRERLGEVYKIDIGTSAPATLPMLAFEGATKKNRPNLVPGAVVYARLVVANKDMESELVCYASNLKAEGYGELVDGFVFPVSLSYARWLLDPQCAILQTLGEHMTFEICVGLNGLVWIKTPSDKHTVLIANAIRNAEFLSPKQISTLISQLVQQL